MSKALICTGLYKNNINNRERKDEFNNFRLKKTLKNKLLVKLYNNKYLNKNRKDSKSLRLKNLINDMDEQLNIQYDQIFNKFLSHNIKIFDIISLHFKIKYLEEYFATKSNDYSYIDKIDFYNFLVVFNELIDEINDSNDNIY